MNLGKWIIKFWYKTLNTEKEWIFVLLVQFPDGVDHFPFVELSAVQLVTMEPEARYLILHVQLREPPIVVPETICGSDNPDENPDGEALVQ